MLHLGKKYPGQRNLSQTANNIFRLGLPPCLQYLSTS